MQKWKTFFCFVLQTACVACAQADRGPGTADQRLGASEVAAGAQTGDVLLIQSQSAQSPALREGTGSPWTHVGVVVQVPNQTEWFVAEASSGIEVTPLARFLAKSQGGTFVLRRVKGGLTDAQKTTLVPALLAFGGKPYDIYFEWSDDAIYCSELVFKAFERALGLQIGAVQMFRDLRLDGPLVRALIRARYTSRGRPFDPTESIVTPVSQLDSQVLETIASSL